MALFAENAKVSHVPFCNVKEIKGRLFNNFEELKTPQHYEG